jgi:uncharacterized protein YkwD
VSATRTLSVIVQIILSCTAIALSDSPPAAASNPRHSARLAGSPQRALHHCPASGARRARRGERACRAAHGRAPKPVKARLVKPVKFPKRQARQSAPANAPTTHASEAAASQAPAAHAAAIAAVLATPCANTEVTPEAANLGLVRAAILCLINVKRAEDGESPLAVNPKLEAAAESHCQELVADDYFAHVSPSGETPVDRIRETGYIPGPNVGYVIGENLAWGTYQLSTPKAIASAWFASPEHLANILESQYTETGIGVTAAVPASLGEGAPGATYAQEFGVIVE